MIKVKTSKLTGHALDYAVAIAEGYGPGAYLRNIVIRLDVKGKCSLLSVPINREYVVWSPSTDWAQGGPIIAREGISMAYKPKDARGLWHAVLGPNRFLSPAYEGFGATPLVAAMRCYVASKLGDMIEIPSTLID